MATVNSSSSPSCPKPVVKPARYCLCAPTTHPGSFRCRLHRPRAAKGPTSPSGPDQPAAKEAAAAAEKKKEEAAAAAARVLLARMARTSRKNVIGRVKGFEPAPSRLRIMDG